MGFHITFTDDRTVFTPVNVADVEGLSSRLPLWVRTKHAVAHQPKTYAALADELDAKVDSVEAAVRRKPQVFTRIQTGSLPPEIEFSTNGAEKARSRP